MMEILGINISIRFLAYLVLAFSFFVGILLVVSHEAFIAFNKALQKEYGLERKIVAPKLEENDLNVVDQVLLKYRFWAGLFICISAFSLLLVYK